MAGVAGQTSDTVDMLCKECHVYITNVGHMRKKGSQFTCKDPGVKQRIAVVSYQKKNRYRDSETIGEIKCGNPACGQKLGIAVNFLDSDGDVTLKGYGFSVKSFCFKFSETHKEMYKQWKKVPLDIPFMEGI
ncbi:uncharacterized protein [Amphiura filiformis]|uniref:uncharacterized protein n=1 Tax=Amphiura filiformis TaxID=82378 RepID=UPI003B20EF83